MPHDDHAQAARMTMTSPDVRWPAALRWFDLTLPSPEENLALDEALLEEVESDSSRAVLRFWESHRYCVVLGRSNRIETEVHIEACRLEGIPVLRRSSGGGAVVIGPGCLAYALALPLADEYRGLGVAALTLALMERMASGLRSIIPDVAVYGTSDLVVNGRKFSGNSQRWLRKAFLHHGTILYDFDLPRIERLLRQPSRQPEYRAGRSHDQFVTNIQSDRRRLMECLVETWLATSAACTDRVLTRASELSRTRYATGEWTLHC